MALDPLADRLCRLCFCGDDKSLTDLFATSTEVNLMEIVSRHIGEVRTESIGERENEKRGDKFVILNKNFIIG